jgi:anti-sigma regulatory factor (Ser/Thr protein kinase)
MTPRVETADERVHLDNVYDTRLVLDLPGEISHIGMVRRVVRSALEPQSVPVGVIDDAETLVGEMATNAVRHGRSKRYQVVLVLNSHRLILIVTDHGLGFDRGAVARPGSARGADEDERFGGWGLPLIENLAHRVRYMRVRPHGTRVRAEIRLDVPCGQRPALEYARGVGVS